MIDSNGFRPNVGIIICNKLGQLFWAKRIKQDAWQFPQGGIKETETAEEALFRELSEEVGLCKDDVRILSQTSEWLKYRLPKPYIRQRRGRTCIGQKQKWFLFKLKEDVEKKLPRIDSIDMHSQFLEERVIDLETLTDKLRNGSQYD